MTDVKRKRGRPKKVVPFFANPEAERQRVEQCLAQGRNPHPRFKHEPCQAELELRKDVMPGVPFELVLAINDTDEYGGPTCSPTAEKRWEEAKATRKLHARGGGEQRCKANLAARIIAQEADYIRAKKAEGWSKSRVFRAINARRTELDAARASRTEMYDQLNLSGLWSK